MCLVFLPELLLKDVSVKERGWDLNFISQPKDGNTVMERSKIHLAQSMGGE